MKIVDDKMWLDNKDWSTGFAKYAIDLIKQKNIKAFYSKEGNYWYFYDGTYKIAFELFEYACKNNFSFKGLVQSNYVHPDNKGKGPKERKILTVAVLNSEIKKYKLYSREEFIKIKDKYPQICLLKYWEPK